MATAKQKRGATPSAAKVPPAKMSPLERKVQRQIERDAKRKENSERFRAGREALKNASLEVLEAAIKPTNAPEDKKKPKKFTPELVDEFVELVALGTPISKIAKLPQFPKEYYFWRDIADEQSEISRAYARGKKILAVKLEETIEEIATTPVIGRLTTTRQSDRDGVTTEVKQYEMLEHRRLLIDTHKWTLAHLRPRKHGRNADPSAGQPNEQLKALFDALNAGPVE